jgi:hypothetical protein
MLRPPFGRIDASICSLPVPRPADPLVLLDYERKPIAEGRKMLQWAAGVLDDGAAVHRTRQPSSRLRATVRAVTVVRSQGHPPAARCWCSAS